MNPALRDCSFRISTARTGSPTAIAIIELFAPTAAVIDAAVKFIGGASMSVGEVKLRSIAGIDQGLIARWDDRHISLMPHAGPFILRRIAEHLVASGAALIDDTSRDPRDLYPEAADLVEACMLEVLARAASPLAVDVLLAQPDHWRSKAASASPAQALAFQRLIDPPLVVAVGPPNVGKSSLTNALARRGVSIVSPEAGTTRDHVGVTLNFAGLVVRWIDTPGLRDAPLDPIEVRSVELARQAVAESDLILSCGDQDHAFITSVLPTRADTILIRCATRSDLGLPAVPFDVRTSAATGEGLDTLAAMVRESLVPARIREAPVKWAFHPRLTTLVPKPRSGDTL